MSTTKQLAAQIRATIKSELGLNSRQVSIRTRYASMMSAIDATIKDATVTNEQFAAIERIVEGSESIRRCEFSGEILGGGNRYTSVRWSSEARRERAQQFVDVLSAAIEELDGLGSSSALVPIEGTDVEVGSDGIGGYRFWTDRAGMHFNTVECGAAVLADMA